MMILFGYKFHVFTESPNKPIPNKQSNERRRERKQMWWNVVEMTCGCALHTNACSFLPSTNDEGDKLRIKIFFSVMLWAQKRSRVEGIIVIFVLHFDICVRNKSQHMGTSRNKNEHIKGIKIHTIWLRQIKNRVWKQKSPKGCFSICITVNKCGSNQNRSSAF